MTEINLPPALAQAATADEIIDRVLIPLLSELHFHRTTPRELARVAILATLDAIREPSEAMIRSVPLSDVVADDLYDIWRVMIDALKRDIWRAMIDALKREIAG